MPEYVSCDLCGADDARRLYRRKDYRLRVDETPWDVLLCRSCGLGYVNPRPTRAEVGRYYPSGYYSTRDTQSDRYRRLADLVPGTRGRILDVGTARGDFLVEMKKRGWGVEGVEPFDDAGNPHGLPIHRVQFPDGCDALPGDYDVVSAWAVFEHLHEPKAAFAACARLLKPHGVFVLQVPNLRSVQSRWTLQEDIPRHLYFFSPRTLRRYAAGAGLQLERIVHTTDLFGGSGRGAFSLAISRALGQSDDQYVELARLRRSERFRRRPLITILSLAGASLERVVLTDWLARATRTSGQIVAFLRRPD